MFYVRYLFAEVFRRLGKTLIVTTGLAVTSAIVILIISTSQALSSSQEQVLNPLENVGTDILVSLSATADRLGKLDEATRLEYLDENATKTDLSQLGDPGDEFSNDQFLSGTMLTFKSSITGDLDPSLVANYAQGLIYTVTHQEGLIPKVTTSIETGGKTYDVEGDIAPMTAAEEARVGAAKTQAAADLQERGIDLKSPEASAHMMATVNNAMPERFKGFKKEFTTPKETITKDVGPISTDISTSNFTVGGVDADRQDIGLIIPSEIVEGNYFDESTGIIVNKAYADKNDISLGDTFTLGDVSYDISGVVEPKLYTNTADIYLPLEELQRISDKEHRVNVLLIKSTDVDSMSATEDHLESLLPGAVLVSAKDIADKVSGSLVRAADLTDRFVRTVSILIIAASFIIVSLLTVSSINRRTREIGTLKAIGWSNFKVIRQIVSESVFIGFLGAVIGIGLGLLAIYIFNQNNISLDALIETTNATQGLLGGKKPIEAASTTAIQTSVELKILPSTLVLALGGLVAISGALISAFFAALKVSRLRPQVALRNLD